MWWFIRICTTGVTGNCDVCFWWNFKCSECLFHSHVQQGPSSQEHMVVNLSDNVGSGYHPTTSSPPASASNAPPPEGGSPNVATSNILSAGGSLLLVLLELSKRSSFSISEAMLEGSTFEFQRWVSQSNRSASLCTPTDILVASCNAMCYRRRIWYNVLSAWLYLLSRVSWHFCCFMPNHLVEFTISLGETDFAYLNLISLYSLQWFSGHRTGPISHHSTSTCSRAVSWDDRAVRGDGEKSRLGWLKCGERTHYCTPTKESWGLG